MKTLAEIMPELNQACDEIDKLYEDAEKALEGIGIAAFAAPMLPALIEQKKPDGAFNKKIEYKRIDGRYRIGLDGGGYLYPFKEASRSLKIEMAVTKEANRLVAEARKILAAQTKA